VIRRIAVSGVLAADGRRLSLVDCTSLETMRHLELHKVFSFDRHFSEQGFTTVP